MKRRVSIPRGWLGSWAAYPNFYIIFVSPPATARKSTTVGYADDLLENVPKITVAASAPSVQVLHKRIADSGDSSISIRSPEFATFINTSGLAMIDYLTDLFDGKKHHSSDTLARSLEFAERPCVNLLAATTPLWISENLSEQMIGGGFTSRVLFVYESGVRRRKLFYRDVDHVELDLIKDRLIEDLVHLSTNIEGEFNFTPEAEEFASKWYSENADKWEKETDKRLVGYVERKPAHVMKLSMLLHLAHSDDLIITIEDFTQAIGLLEQVESKMLQVFQSIGKNIYTSEMDAITDYIKAKGQVTRKELLGRFYHSAPPAMLLELINALIVMGRITADGSDPTHITYKYVTASKNSSPRALPQRPEPRSEEDRQNAGPRSLSMPVGRPVSIHDLE
jgi:hypothetical protein